MYLVTGEVMVSVGVGIKAQLRYWTLGLAKSLDSPRTNEGQ